MSSNLRKLRFMQKSEDKPEAVSEKVVNTLIGDQSVWIRPGFEEIHRLHDEKAETKKKYHRIRYMTRYAPLTRRLSFNGMNPAVEGYMAMLQRKQRTNK